MNFEQKLDLINLVSVSELKKGRPTYIFFGGLQGNMAVPMFEFKGISSQLGDVNKVYFRDLSQTWYHGIFKDIIKHLEDIIKQVDTNSLIFCGNSMGGYAALLFGHLFAASKTIVFSAQTCIEYSKKVKTWGDSSFEAFIEKARKVKGAQTQYFDLAYIDFTEEVHLYFCGSNFNDKLHARNIKGESVKAHNLDSGGHNAVTVLLHQERLIDILKE